MCVLYVVIKCLWTVALPLVHILDLVGAQEWWWGVSEARSVGTSYLTAKANNMLQHSDIRLSNLSVYLAVREGG